MGDMCAKVHLKNQEAGWIRVVDCHIYLIFQQACGVQSGCSFGSLRVSFARIGQKVVNLQDFKCVGHILKLGLVIFSLAMLPSAAEITSKCHFRISDY